MAYERKVVGWGWWDFQGFGFEFLEDCCDEEEDCEGGGEEGKAYVFH